MICLVFVQGSAAKDALDRQEDRSKRASGVTQAEGNTGEEPHQSSNGFIVPPKINVRAAFTNRNWVTQRSAQCVESAAGTGICRAETLVSVVIQDVQTRTRDIASTIGIILRRYERSLHPHSKWFSNISCHRQALVMSLHWYTIWGYSFTTGGRKPMASLTLSTVSFATSFAESAPCFRIKSSCPRSSITSLYRA